MLKALWHELGDTLRAMLHWVEGFAATPHGTWALFVISFLESSVFPIPPDVLLIALCVGDPSRSLWFALICSLASVLGGMGGYALGYFGGRPLLKRFFSARRVAAVESYYDRYNAWAIGIAGLTPLPYKLFTISGGACAINFKIFLLASVVSRSVRFFAVAGLIYLFGPPIKSFLEEYLDVLSVAFVILLVLGFWLARIGVGRAGAAHEEAPPEEGGTDV
ncbi:MAG TPA: YqaA family protein [Thermoanaerobaculia bacterium]|nr:YqaA family protein [Thermoanaerobaculia bacterium]